MSAKCLVDDTDLPDLGTLHKYLRVLKVKQADYYEKYFPRMDLLTGEKIPFKDYDSYQVADFLNKNNLKRYCSENPKAGIEWSKKYLENRRIEKGAVRALHHVTLRTLFCPSVTYFEKYGDYNEICKSIGYQPVFDYKVEPKFTKLPDGYKILTDSREQKTLLVANAEKATLNFGDYTLDKGNNKGIYIERKSLPDLAGTLSKGLERFGREIDRAKKANAYLVVLVEQDINTALSFNYLPQMKFTKVQPDFIFKNMRDLLHTWDNLQFLFVDGRKDAPRVLLKLFEMGEQVKTCDCQYYYEKGKI